MSEPYGISPALSTFTPSPDEIATTKELERLKRVENNIKYLLSGLKDLVEINKHHAGIKTVFDPVIQSIELALTSEQTF